MRQTLAAAALVSVLALSWIGLFQSFSLAAGLAIIGLLLAPFLIFATEVRRLGSKESHGVMEPRSQRGTP